MKPIRPILTSVAVALIAATAMAQSNTFPWPTSGNVGIGTTSPNEKLEVFGNIKLSSSAITSGVRALSPTGWGYSPNAYRVVQVGAASGNESVAIGFDPSGNPNGGFTGDGREILFRRGAQFVTPNAANNSWFNFNLVLLDGRVGIGRADPGDKLHVTVNASDSGITLDDGGNNFNPVFTITRAGYARLKLSATNAVGTVAGIGSGLSLSGSETGQHMFITSDGNVGIGTTTPHAQLQIGTWNLIKNGTWADPAIPSETSGGERISFYEGGGWKTAIGMGGANEMWFQSHVPSGAAAFRWFSGANNTAPNEIMRITGSGNVGIGTANPQSALAVNGTITTKEVVVTTSGWADYVFADSYNLAPLSEVEQQIKSQKHLPGIPSASDVAKSGISLGDMQAKLLAKIEELTLHQIDQEKQQREQSNQLVAQQRQLTVMEKENTELRSQIRELRAR